MEHSTVYFIGAGPGDPELLTLKGQRIIQQADLVLYAGSLVPQEIVEQARPGAEVADSSAMTLEETHALICSHIRNSGIVARVHTGDPSLFGAVREQIALLEQDAIAYEIVPGVTAAFAAAAAAKVSFTIPERTQSLILTRIAGHTPVPAGEDLEDLARHGCALVLYLSASRAEEAQGKLLDGGYSEQTPVVIASRVGWPGEQILFTRLGKMAATAARESVTRQAVFLVLPHQEGEAPASRLYSRDFEHGFRRRE
jgi:precorrin-4/cobalt-precorrin-4 C11-methyltransferase